MVPARVIATPEAEAMMRALTQTHGALMFHQSGGCCDGSAPMCFPRGEFKVGTQDVLLGHVAGDIPVWIGSAQFDYWRHTQVMIDVVPGRGAGMSLESPEFSRMRNMPRWRRQAAPSADAERRTGHASPAGS